MKLMNVIDYSYFMGTTLLYNYTLMSPGIIFKIYCAIVINYFECIHYILYVASHSLYLIPQRESERVSNQNCTLSKIDPPTRIELSNV